MTKPQQQDHVQQAIFSSALSRAMDRAGLNVTDVQAGLRQSGESVSDVALDHWLSGQALPQTPGEFRALAMIERVLQTAPGLLIGASAPPRPRRGKPREAKPLPLVDELAHAQKIRDTMIEMSLDHADVRPTWIHLRLDLDASGQEQRMTVSNRLRAVVPQAHRWVAAQLLDQPVGTTSEPFATAGCQIGEVRRDSEVGFVVTEMRLTEPLELGAETEVTYGFAIPTGQGLSFHYDHVIPDPCQQATLEVRFNKAKLPVAVEGLTVVDGRDTSIPVRRQRNTASVQVADFGPGVLAMNWEWAED